MRKYREYTDNDIISYSKDVKSVSQLLEKLNLRKAGGNFSHIKKSLQRLNIDCSHWTGQAWNKDQQLKDWSSYSKVESIKPHLIKLRGYKCESCLLETWMNYPITLEVDHVNGDRTDNNLENLKLLCCNCHALTPTWRNKKR